MVDLSSSLCKRLPEGKPPFSYGFPMVFLWFSMVFYGFPMVFYGFPMVFYGFPMVPHYRLCFTARCLHDLRERFRHRDLEPGAPRCWKQRGATWFHCETDLVKTNIAMQDGPFIVSFPI